MKALISALPASVFIAQILTIPPAHAQTEPEEDVQAPITITGSRIALPAARRGRDVSIISRETIEASGATSSLDLLRLSPGLDVVQEGAAGNASFVSIRGGDENFIQVLIDGVKVNDPTDSAGGAFDFNLVDPLQIEQVEISRKVGSSVYGSDSLSGLVQIQTRRAEDEIEQSLRVQADTENAYNAGYFITGPIGETLVSATLSHRDGGTQVDGDRYKRTGFNGTLERDLGDSHTLFLSTFLAQSQSERFPETSGGPRLAELRETEDADQNLYIANARLTSEVNDQLSLQSVASFTRSELEIDNPGIIQGSDVPVPPFFSDSEFDRLELTSSLLFSPAQTTTGNLDFDLSVGLGYLNEDGRSDGGVDFGIIIPEVFELQRETLSGFAELATNIGDDVSLITSLRYDAPDGFDNETTLGALFVYEHRDTDTVFDLSWGQGFKLPSFFALGSALVGNPDLKPEESENLSASVRQGLSDKGLIQITLFQNEYINLIDFDATLFTNVNLGKVDVQGVEGSITLHPSETLSLGANVTLSESEVDGKATQLRFRPETKASAYLDWALTDDWSLGGQTRFVGERPDESTPTGPIMLDEYLTQDVYLAYTANEIWTARFDVINLADEDYEEVIGFPARGRTLQLTLTSNF